MTPQLKHASQDRIVVGVDGSAASKAALRWAVTMSTVTGGHIEAITTWQIPVTYGWALMSGGWAPEKEAKKLLTETVDSVFGDNRPVDLRLIVEEGNPAKVLITHSAGARMLVVGSRGLGGFAGLLLGSVSAACAEHASCPVLVVHEDGESEAETETKPDQG
jgi:nucleotide-binding universal stress UspA family protein